MAKVLFTVWPFAGHLHPAIAIAHALLADGHDVGFYSGESVRSQVESEGFRFFAFRRIDEGRITLLASSEFPFCPSLWQRIQSARKLQIKFREWLLDTIPQQLEDLEELSLSWQPDIVVCDLAFWGPFLVLKEMRRIPVAVLSILAACILPGPDAPSWGQGTPRPSSVFSRLRATFERTLLRWLSVGFRSNVNAMRVRYNLPPIDCSVTEFAAKMPLYLVPSAPEYDYDRKDLPKSVNYVGPCLWDKPTRNTAPEWLIGLSLDLPVIYVTEATIGCQEPLLLKTAIHAFKGQSLEVIMTTGRQRNTAELGLGTIPANIRIESYVPQSDLLPKVAVMVTLGGSGGVLAALTQGVPLVIVPTEWDRPENAQRVVEAGAGLRISPRQCTPERLLAAVRRVLNEPSFRQNAQRLSASFSRYGGPAQAASLIESLLPAGTSASAGTRMKVAGFTYQAGGG